MRDKVFLETDRLVLRQFTEEDAGLLLELDSDPEVMRYIGPFALPDRDAYRRHIQTTYLGYYARYEALGVWAAINRTSGEFLGWFCLRPALDYRYATEADFRTGEVELGYRLRRSAWGKGYATEGARALVQRAWVDAGISGVVAAALIGNVASCRVLKQAGLRRIGEFVLPGFDQPGVKYALWREQLEPAARAAASAE